MIAHRALAAGDRARVVDLLRSIAAFGEAERAVALELVDARLAHPNADDCRFVVAADDATAEIAGYLCYGRTPMTERAYDLYWLVVAPPHARSSVAADLVARMEREVSEAGGGLVRVEAGSREAQGATLRFYAAAGFTRATTLEDFYAAGDDLVLFTRRVPAAADAATGAGGAAELDEAALQDAAFGYRDYAKERDFLLACAARFGARDVRRVLAWASGSGRHLLAFADGGASGVGVDGSPALVAYATRLASSRSLAPAVSFRVGALGDAADLGGPFDLSFVPLSSIHQLGSEALLVRHLEAAAVSLAPGGVHVIEATHPGDLSPAGANHTEWTEVRGDLVIDARFRMHLDRRVGSVVPVTLDVVCAGDKRASPRGRLKQEDRWFIPDLATWRSVAARVPAFELAAALGDFRVDVPFEHSAAWRLILVLRRT